MSTRAQQAQLLKDQTFQDQVEGALIAAASNVMNEAAGAPHHEPRLKWANAIIASSRQQMAFFLAGMLTNPSISANAATPLAISDGDVDYVVASLFDKYADQYAAQQNIGAPLQLGNW